MPRDQIFFECPHCGEDVPVGAKVCRECGASDDAGWNDDDFGDSWHDDYEDPIYKTHDASLDPVSHSVGNVRFWVRLVILALMISFVLTLRLL